MAVAAEAAVVASEVATEATALTAEKVATAERAVTAEVDAVASEVAAEEVALALRVRPPLPLPPLNDYIILMGNSDAI